MKVSGFRFCALFLVVGAALTFLNFSCPIAASCFPDFFATNYGESGDRSTLIAVSRKLKETCSITSKNKGDAGRVTVDDYHPIDPVPSSNSKASVKPGPIEHGSPLMPYIPKPSPPPANLKAGGSK